MWSCTFPPCALLPPGQDSAGNRALTDGTLPPRHRGTKASSPRFSGGVAVPLSPRRRQSPGDEFMSQLAILDEVVVHHVNGGGISWSIGDILIWLLIAVGVVAITVIVLRVLGWQIPQWVWQIVGICVAVVIGILAIRFLLSL